MTELNYASTSSLNPRVERLCRIFHRLALTCALLPMLIGIAILLAYAITNWELLIAAGVWMLYIGVAAFLVGLTFAILWIVFEIRLARQAEHPAPWRGFFLLLLLLFANFAVAFFCTFVGAAIAISRLPPGS